MLHIDVDEFLSVIPRSRRSRTVDLAKMADKYFLRHPTIPALSFAPIHMYHCPRLNVQRPSELVQLPRVHTWNHGNLSDRSIHNGKLLMRTEAVGGFFVHYITMLEDYPRNESHPNRSWNPSPYRVPITFPHIFRGVDSHGSLLRAQRAEGQAQGTFCSSITTISAVGCDARMGSHLLRTANAWQRASSKGSVCAQLEKMDMSNGEAGEINETLVTAAQKYNASTEGL
jgi:hypothetical protein